MTSYEILFKFKPHIRPVYYSIRKVDVNYRYYDLYKDVKFNGKVEDDMPINTPGKFSAWYPYLFPRMLWEVWNNDIVDLSTPIKVLKYFKIDPWLAYKFSPSSIRKLQNFINVVYAKSLTKGGEIKV